MQEAVNVAAVAFDIISRAAEETSTDFNRVISVNFVFVGVVY